MHDRIDLMVVPRGFNKVRVMQRMWISPFSSLMRLLDENDQLQYRLSSEHDIIEQLASAKYITRGVGSITGIS